MNRIIRKALASWQRWRYYRALPEIRERAEALDRARKAHKSTRAIERDMRRIVVEALRG